MEIHRIPVISTGHLDRNTPDMFTQQGDDNPWCPCAQFQYGYFLYLDDPDSSPPPCLLDIRDWLRTQQAAGLITGGWVRLDSDADTVPDLPTYNW